MRTGHADVAWGRSAATLAGSIAVMSAVLIALGLLLTHALGPVTRWDDHVNGWFGAHRTTTWDHISTAGTFIANTLGVAVVALVVTAVAALRRWGRMAALLVCGLAVELSVFLITNYTVARPRPSVKHLGSTPSTFSFPSGHVAATLVLYGGIALLVASRTDNRLARGIAWLVAALFAAWVGFSRVYEGQHHPTDVFAGALVGVGALIAAMLTLRASEETNR